MCKWNTPKMECYGATTPKQHRTPEGRNGTRYGPPFCLSESCKEARLNDKAETNRLRIPLVQQQNSIAALMSFRAYMSKSSISLNVHSPHTLQRSTQAGKRQLSRAVNWWSFTINNDPSKSAMSVLTKSNSHPADKCVRACACTPDCGADAH